MPLRRLAHAIAFFCLGSLSLIALAADLKPTDRQRAPQFSGEYYPLEEITTPPRPEKRVAPRYPVEERRAGRQGVARVAFIVNADGSTEELHLVDATSKAFGKAALAAVAQWRFTPGELNGRRVRVAMVINVPFTLNVRP